MDAAERILDSVRPDRASLIDRGDAYAVEIPVQDNFNEAVRRAIEAAASLAAVGGASLCVDGECYAVGDVGLDVTADERDTRRGATADAHRAAG